MKEGKYFRIPQRPADLERLWEEAERLDPADLPDWLTPEDAAGYRLVGSVSCPQAPGPGAEDYLAEVEELEAAGLILHEQPGEGYARRIYLKEPRKDPVWSIGLYRGDSPFNLAPAEGVHNPVLTAEDVADVPASFIADPFMLHADGAWHMFFEVMNWRRNLGEIGHADSADGVTWTYRRIVLSERFHFSYPYVFRWHGDYYMIPETYQAGAVLLYRAVHFPWEWACVATLLEGPYLADSSVFRHDGAWWMFVDTSEGMSHDTLRLYRADELTGPWQEHPHSPILQGDPVRARPAGRVSVINGKIFRYAQNSVPYYGMDVRAFEVDELTATSYREREVSRSPILKGSGSGWNGCGMHHLDAHFLRDGSWVACVDGWTHDAVLQALQSRNGQVE